MASRPRVFAWTWLSYFSYYQSRKNVSFVKTQLEDQGVATKHDLVTFDTAYLTFYAVGMFVWGALVERVSPRRMVALGMFASALLNCLFASSDLFAVMALAWGLNGLAQSTGWPGNSRITANWFSATERGVVLGWWSTCYQIGPLVAAWVAPLFFRFGWQCSLFGPALWVAMVALGFYLWVSDTPESAATRLESHAPPRAHARLAFAQLARNPMVWVLGVAYFCIKLTRYSLWFWLPYYFTRELHYHEDVSARLSSAFDVGGIAGVVLAGYLSDVVLRKRRVLAAALLMFMLAGAIALYNAIGATGVVGNVIGLALVGALLFGADSIVSGSAAQDVGGPLAAGAVCAFVNGLGSIGAITQGWVTETVSDAFGWPSLFTLFLILALAGGFALLPFARQKPSE